MIFIKITVQGEPDTSPFTKIYSYYRKSDEEIFIRSALMIKDRLDKNFKININESLLLYSKFIVSELRDGKSIEQIQKNTSNLLSPEQVMIGVPETLRQISFKVMLDNESMKSIVLNAPIQISDYILKST
ncbi:MAG: urease subunit gamma [Nitrosarchaeum sp.]|nr:urease subunit gamma [Nitrosarchaeum sp.]